MQQLWQFIAAACLFFGVHGSAWPVPYEVTSDTFPNVELSLSPPTQPLPQVAAAIRNLESARERFEAAHMDDMQGIFKQEVRRARKRAADIVGDAMRIFADSASVVSQSNGVVASRGRDATSFLSARSRSANADHVVVNVMAVPAGLPNPALRQEVDATGKRQLDALQHMFQQATADVQGLTDGLLNEFQEQVQAHFEKLLARRAPHSMGGQSHEKRTLNRAGFVESRLARNAVGVLPGQANVHVVAASSSSPALSSAVQDMATRAGITERLGRSKLLQSEMDLVKAVLRVMKSTLQAAVTRLVEAQP